MIKTRREENVGKTSVFLTEINNEVQTIEAKLRELEILAEKHCSQVKRPEAIHNGATTDRKEERR